MSGTRDLGHVLLWPRRMGQLPVPGAALIHPDERPGYPATDPAMGGL